MVNEEQLDIAAIDRAELVRDIAAALNRNSAENATDTPDFILAEYLVGCLESFDRAFAMRKHWYRPEAGCEDGGASD